MKGRCVISDMYYWQTHRAVNDSDSDNSDASVSRDHLHSVNTVLPLTYVGGLDISFVKGDDVNACAALVVIHFPSLKVRS